MALVTAEEVQQIIEVDSTVVTDLTPFITAAHLLVDEELSDSSIGHSDARLKEIERWLAAHFVAIMDKRVSSETAGSVSQSFQYKLGLNLQVTVYGQQAILLDTSGILAGINESGATTYRPKIEVID